MGKAAILVPCYKRPEYTEKCIRALEGAQAYADCRFFLVDDGSNDGTSEILKGAALPKEVIIHPENIGLRHALISFIKVTSEFEYITVVGNDCLMPENWLSDLISILVRTDLDIVSPNVIPSNAAHKWGSPDIKGLGYRPAKTVGGLWTMRHSLTDGIYMENIPCRGIIGAFQILRQIIMEKDPKVGWVTEVEVQDIGHWTGLHPLCIKTDEHRRYYNEVGRRIVW